MIYFSVSQCQNAPYTVEYNFVFWSCDNFYKMATFVDSQDCEMYKIPYLQNHPTDFLMISTLSSFASDFQWFCLADQGSPSVTQHGVSVESSSLLFHTIKTRFINRGLEPAKLFVMVFVKPYGLW